MRAAANALAAKADWALPRVAEAEILTGSREPEAIAARLIQYPDDSDGLPRRDQLGD